MHTYTHSRHYQLFTVVFGKAVKIIKSRGVYVAFYSYMRVGNNVLFP